MKRIILLATIAMIVIVTPGLCWAEGDNYIVKVNDQVIAFDTEPVMVNGEILAPLRAICEALGGYVEWEEQTKTGTINDRIVIQIDNTTAIVDGEEIEMPVAGTVINNRTMLPVRFVTEHLGFIYSFDDSTNTVNITEGTEVSGIISQDTTWTKEESPYLIDGEISIIRDTTLTIEPGVIINGGTIASRGNITALGTAKDYITFNNTSIQSLSWEMTNIQISYANLNNFSYRSFLPYKLALLNSNLSGTTINLYEPRGESFIEDNKFNNYSNINITSSNAITYIRRNTFNNNGVSEDITIDFTNKNKQSIIINNNNFMNSSRKILGVYDTGSGSHIDAKYNFWGTTDEAIIN